MFDIEAERQANLLAKQRLLEELEIGSGIANAQPDQPIARPRKRKLGISSAQPLRSSARIAASASIRTDQDDERSQYKQNTKDTRSRPKQPIRKNPRTTQSTKLPNPPVSNNVPASSSLADLMTLWNSWAPSAREPTLTPDGTYHFPDFPEFTPNKSPISMLLEGAFGGTFFSPWYSRTLSLELRDDYLMTLPKSWLAQLRPPRKYITSPTYQPALNKFQVSSGQNQSEWEAAGWINFNHDPRGWYEWYIRFFLGRRCDDDQRQVGRWSRCVGVRGRWRRLLLKKYVEMGVKTVGDEGGDDDVWTDDQGDVQSKQISPVMHQTCHHWAYEVRQEDLDLAWVEHEQR
ncbi:hypothetical protein PV10_07154 [Exophiala mesophila]|uniref:Uncharacterized protein n=1 Tax=Exophiala mesophila TaxID=212818 RepID=A0A0D1XNU8_EXOME|nr:uncharacterized protein PV10_07154 [Exophiala mesophila]KIV89776.1 hypothetical protein PV10_07154 [Exophiala mesophila]